MSGDEGPDRAGAWPRLACRHARARTAALFQLAVELPAGILARCLGIDISSAVAWQRAAAGDWHPVRRPPRRALPIHHERSIHWLIRDHDRGQVPHRWSATDLLR
ncbi:hypothetical protein Psuf_060470 [Phytohabitans suffuscus]|uniref:Transposase n=1 Tax=Phytohabitans suffuscus TaxID=624315 RepID=A0A6F8YRK7_9ACTN|nr:hypothetical protein Psuf_060470 [Phytohabitans suffuscus]